VDWAVANQRKIDAIQQLAPLADALDDIEARIDELVARTKDQGPRNSSSTDFSPSRGNPNRLFTAGSWMGPRPLLAVIPIRSPARRRPTNEVVHDARSNSATAMAAKTANPALLRFDQRRQVGGEES